jgi:predicted ATPase/DNA-binding winged helix-turn-helix (wHTH) protein
MPARSFSFGQFKLLADEQRLLRNDLPVRLGSRALAILLLLLEHAGELVSKQDLLSRVWPDTFVDESNLKVNIAALRRALDESNNEISHIANVSGRGYRFVAPVSLSQADNTLQSRRKASNLPHSMKQIVGRDDTVQRIIAQLSDCGFLTIVGSAGVGKTAVAVVIAETLLQIYKDGVFFVDFACLEDPGGVPNAISTALGLPVTTQNATQQLCAHLQNREILLVVDSCEHVSCSATECLELIQSFCPNVDILATSREPLGGKRERLYRLPPLAVPAPGSDFTVDVVRAFPSVELFLRRSTENLSERTIDQSLAVTVGELCRELDGIPLAIELAAVRVRLLGFEGLSSMANDDFLQFRRSHHTDPPRHQSLAAAYEWCFDSLPENERSAFLRLSTLSGSFDLKTAVFVASGGTMNTAEATACIANLVSKSLVERLDHRESRFRLLHMIRYFASTKRTSSDEASEAEIDEGHFATPQWSARRYIAGDLLTA